MNAVDMTKISKGMLFIIINAVYFCNFAEDLCGIFVKSVIEGSMADKSGCIMCNDQITEVDGTPLSGVSNAEAVEMLKRTGNPVRLAIVRYLRYVLNLSVILVYA